MRSASPSSVDWSSSRSSTAVPVETPVASAASRFRNKAKMVVSGTVQAPVLGILREILGPSGRQGQQVTGRWEGRDETVKHLSHVPERTCIGCRAKGPRA
ncbi:MAG: hypothetical protein Q621_VSBC00101G0002, partial [Veillonella sp. DORA_B_18_19_23]